jgi:MinD-like ATPase involved in chromosome partitioning or flagellar assembly
MTESSKRVVFTMGGKGGVGKTGVVVALAEWFQANEIPVTLLDLDTENKARGSLKHFFNGTVTKVDVHTPAGLDAFVDHLDSGTPIILADMGAGAGQVAAGWFDSMYEDVAATGVRFTAVGIVTPDPASVESVLAWANRLQDRVEYVIVENATSALADFTYWHSTKQANQFREAFAPAILQMEFRLAELENPLRQHGIQLGQVADRKTTVDELKRASLIMRAQSYRRRLFSEFDRAREAFLP